MSTSPRYSFDLIPGGFDIYLDGRPLIHQPFRAGAEGLVPYADAEREAAARATILELPDPDPDTDPVRRLPPVICELDGDRHRRFAVKTPTTVTGRFRDRATCAVIPINWTFALPVRASDGRERGIGIPVVNGEFTATWTPSESGFWEVTEELVNSRLHMAEMMSFPGLYLDVLE